MASAFRLVCAAGQSTHRPLSRSCLGLPYWILNITHKKELLRGLWVVMSIVQAKFSPCIIGMAARLVPGCWCAAPIVVLQAGYLGSAIHLVLVRYVRVQDGYHEEAISACTVSLM